MGTGWNVQNVDLEVKIALGEVPGQSLSGVVSNSETIGLTYQDIWGVAANFVYPTANETWEVVSSSTDDTLLGSGAQTLTLISLEEDYIEKVTTIELNGTTPVIIDGSHFRTNNFFVASTGTTRGRESTLTLSRESPFSVRSTNSPLELAGQVSSNLSR